MNQLKGDDQIYWQKTEDNLVLFNEERIMCVSATMLWLMFFFRLNFEIILRKTF